MLKPAPHHGWGPKKILNSKSSKTAISAFSLFYVTFLKLIQANFACILFISFKNPHEKFSDTRYKAKHSKVRKMTLEQCSDERFTMLFLRL